MKTRVISGVCIAVITVLLLWLGNIPLTVALCVISCIGYWEMTRAMKCREKGVKVNPFDIVAYIAIIGLYLGIFFDIDLRLLAFGVLFIVNCLMFVYVFSYPKYDIKVVIYSIFAIIYCPLMLSCVLLTRNISNHYDTPGKSFGFYLVWIIFIAAWFSDTFAYFGGVLFGKRKMFPVLSPKKTLAGCIGGILGAILGGVLYGYLLYRLGISNSNMTLIIGGLCGLGSILGQIGDLSASAIKRSFDVKDYSNMIPGHGGIMDRFDSVIFLSPLIFFVCKVLI